MSSRWEKQELRPGAINVGQSITMTYKAIVPLPPIKEIKPGCNCTVANFNSRDNTLTVTYKGESVPKHLLHLGYFIAGKIITVKYVDGFNDVLTFKVRVNKKGL